MAHIPRLSEAFAFAEGLHRRQRRKGSDVPYITHLMAVSAIVGEHSGDEDQMIAALLHDAVEDQGGQATLELIRERFGDDVAHYVLGCSDAHSEPKAPWLERKQTFLKDLRDAPPTVKLIVAADKVHNVRTLVNDLYKVQNALWGRFSGGREGTLWYYQEALRALAVGWEHPILRELHEVVEHLTRLAEDLREDLVPESSAPPPTSA